MRILCTFDLMGTIKHPENKAQLRIGRKSMGTDPKLKSPKTLRLSTLSNPTSKSSKGKADIFHKHATQKLPPV